MRRRNEGCKLKDLNVFDYKGRPEGEGGNDKNNSNCGTIESMKVRGYAERLEKVHVLR